MQERTQSRRSTESSLILSLAPSRLEVSYYAGDFLELIYWFIVTENVAQKTKETVGTDASEVKANANEALGQAKGKASELSGEAKGKANELSGKAKGAAEEAKTKAS